MTTTTWPANGEIKSDHPKRRKFSSEYKLKILAETDACASPSLVAAVLRREGLYASHLSIWRKQRTAGTLSALTPAKPGPKPRQPNPLADRVHELEKANRSLERRLKRAEWLLEVAKKASELMEKMTLAHQLPIEDSE